MPSKIEDYALIGDTHTAALVSRYGSIDWLCLPHFDSDACFASLLGTEEHGYWSIRPTVTLRESRQRYRGDTLILETEFDCEGGSVRIIDFMPPSMGDHDLVRIVEGLEGEVELEMVLAPRFAFGLSAPWIEIAPGEAALTAGPGALRFHGAVQPVDRGSKIAALITVKKGQRVPLVATWYPSHRRPPADKLDAEKALVTTEKYWREWSSRCSYQGPYRDAVMRSLITLKAMTYAPTGAIVAAPTTSLPEQLGGPRNWDYRYCWLRDATLTLQAFMRAGYTDEARAFSGWLGRAIAGSGAEIQIMYGIHGERRLTEVELDWLPGYEGSRPVRVGNDASRQFQLDVFGEVLSALFNAQRLGVQWETTGGWRRLASAMDYLEDAWQRPDDGIWEVRGGRRHFTYSKVMAWVAFDRAVKTIENWNAGGEQGRARLAHWRVVREQIRQEVLGRAFHPGIGAFTQSYGSDALDASVLLIPHTGLLPASDPRVQSTVRAVEKGLMSGGFVQRYATSAGADGLPGTEGAFLACSFWLADNYELVGRHEEAKELFERLLSIRNHVGLLAEEYVPDLRRQISNFPQAFSHLALVSTAYLMTGAGLGVERSDQRGAEMH